MTVGNGLALAAGEAEETLDMGGGSTLACKVMSQHSNGLVTVIEGTVLQGGPPLHVHDDEDEVVIVVDGELDFQLGDQRGRLTSGGMLWMPRQLPHAVSNLSGRPCRFFTVVTPGGIEDFFRAQRDYLQSLPGGQPPDPSDLAAISGAETRRVVGPPLTR